MIQFPGLGLEFNIERVAFSLFGKDVYWYGIIIGLGVMLALIYALYEARRVGFDTNALLDVVIYGILFGIIGARTYYVIFNITQYDSFWDIFKIWEGGIAIYGGLIGSLTAAYIYCKKKNQNFLLLLDVVSVPFLIGQAIGRWGNFVNREAFGGETTLPWRMTIYNEIGKLVSVHPTFLYESLWNVVGIVVLVLYRKHKKFTGELFAMYITWYGLGRIWIEGLRTDSLMLGPIRVSQLVALASIGFGVYMLVTGYKRVKNSDNKVEEMVVKPAPEPKK
ncbi:MAG: prolipoprotein diacylglyceryl transferase [Eubacteriales bacterium]|nr:prolipoprotein diacylglyceryl transferase [Eubacteriales bacterium]